LREITMITQPLEPSLKRELGVFGAMMMGMGSVVGTGVFVSLGVAAGIAGPSVLLAVIAGGLLALCNGISSAQLAASHAVSGGTYEYGYRYLTPSLGFTAGWMFLCAKAASAATAALGFAGYLLYLLSAEESLRTPIALAAVILFTTLVLSGLKRSNWMNIAIVTITLGALFTFSFVGLLDVAKDGTGNFGPLLPSSYSLGSFFYATALMFVAFTGFARIATFGEEVKNPKRTIPLAIMVTLSSTAVLYLIVGVAALGAVGADVLGAAAQSQATPLGAAASALDFPELDTFVALGAVTAMLGVLLNLILGLSRVVLAMGRQGDLPKVFARITPGGGAPSAAVVGVGIAIAALALTGSVETTWAFSAFTVLIYYGITNLAALRLPVQDRRYPRWIAILGLLGCLFLAFWVPPRIWAFGLGLILAGLAWHAVARRIRAGTKREQVS